MSKEEVVAILYADIHLQHKAPVWRSAEPDWYKAMARPLNEIRKVQHKYNECPILCAGDIFDQWNSCPELINFALTELPDKMFCIPGQHDLPNHRYEDIGRSAYYTLFTANKTVDLSRGCRRWLTRGVSLSCFPFGSPIKKLPDMLPNEEDRETIEVAIIHEYVWSGQHKYPTAPKSARVETRSSKMIDGKLYGYDVIVHGDNHSGFLVKVGNTTVFNCGTLMRRHSDEKEYSPQIGLLHRDGSVSPAYLDVSKDKYIPKANMPIESEESFDMGALAQELQKLGHDDRDFKKLLTEYLRSNKVKRTVRNILRQAVDSNE